MCLTIMAANGLGIPYVGYLELSVELCDNVIPKCGISVVQDPPDNTPSQVPCVLGMNVIRKCYN